MPSKSSQTCSPRSQPRAQQTRRDTRSPRRKTSRRSHTGYPRSPDSQSLHRSNNSSAPSPAPWQSSSPCPQNRRVEICSPSPHNQRRTLQTPVAAFQIERPIGLRCRSGLLNHYRPAASIHFHFAENVIARHCGPSLRRLGHQHTHIAPVRRLRQVDVVRV